MRQNPHLAASLRYNTQDGSGLLLLFYIIILLTHGYAMKIIYRSYIFIGMSNKRKKSDINALKILIQRERLNILERHRLNNEKAASAIDV
jgi:hypothetical protein